MAAARVLVVDDSAENRALAKAALEDDDYEVVLAASGAEAIDTFSRERPQCVVMDVQMPGMDGIAACTAIRALPGGDEVAIVFATAQRDITTFDRALAAGGDDFLTKPHRPSELVLRVQAAMRVRRLSGERTELYAEIKRQRDDLQRLGLAREQLASFLVHDFKNPVNSIELQAQRMLRDPAASDRARSAAQAIQTEARALTRMIMNLLDVSRGDEGRLAPARTHVDLSERVEAVIGELRIVAASGEVDLVADVAPGAAAQADPELLHRVLANLVENAIRHAPPGTDVIVRADGAGELRVIDRGPGIPAEQRHRVFDRFESAGGHRNRGLGLAFCKIAVEAHGGTISIEDADPGAVFCVRIPS